VTRRERLVLLASTIGFSMVLLSSAIKGVPEGLAAHELLGLRAEPEPSRRGVVPANLL